MTYNADKNKIDDYFKVEKREERKATIILIAVEFLVLFSSYTKFADSIIIFYALILPFNILGVFLVSLSYRVAINKALDTTIYLSLENNAVSARTRRFLLWKRKDLCFNVQDIKVEPLVFVYKRDVYVESYAIAIKVKNRRLLIVNDFFPEFDKIIEELQEYGVKFMPQSLEVQSFLKNKTK